MLKQIRDHNLMRFKFEHPEFRGLSNHQIALIFDMYKENMTR